MQCNAASSALASTARTPGYATVSIACAVGGSRRLHPLLSCSSFVWSSRTSAAGLAQLDSGLTSISSFDSSLKIVKRNVESLTLFTTEGSYETLRVYGVPIFQSNPSSLPTPQCVPRNHHSITRERSTHAHAQKRACVSILQSTCREPRSHRARAIDVGGTVSAHCKHALKPRCRNEDALQPAHLTAPYTYRAADWTSVVLHLATFATYQSLRQSSGSTHTAQILQAGAQQLNTVSLGG